MSKRLDWTEAHLRDDEHVARVVCRLIAEGIEFDVRPEPDGWWRIRADDKRPYEDATGLHWLIQTTRVAALA